MIYAFDERGKGMEVGNGFYVGGVIVGKSVNTGKNVGGIKRDFV